MLRMSILVLAMVLITQTPESLAALHAYKYYVLAILLSVLIKPWLTSQLD